MPKDRDSSKAKVKVEVSKNLPMEDRFHDMTSMNRRSALKLLGASAALAMGIPGCQRKPARKIVSFAGTPEYQQPGQALYYASTWTAGPYPYGMLIKTVDGRPIKIEGNPALPVNGGASDAPMQASILSLYDPERLRKPRRDGADITWDQADEAITKALASSKKTVLLTGANLGPSELRLIEIFLSAHPQAEHFVHEAVHRINRQSAWASIFGRYGDLMPQFDRARVILSIGSDFLGTDGPVLENMWRFAQTRNPDSGSDLSRLYVIEGTMSLTGANADHRLPLRPSAAYDLLQVLRGSMGGDSIAVSDFVEKYHLDEKVFKTLLSDLRSNQGKALIVAGPHLAESIHGLVLLLNGELGALENTLIWNQLPGAAMPSNPGWIDKSLETGADVVICLGVNAVFDRLGSSFEKLLGKVKVSVGHGLYFNETLSACTYGLPSTHNLEAWNDSMVRDGIYGICQPVIAPLYQSRQEAESLFTWTKQLAPENPELASCNDWHDFVRQNFAEVYAPHADLHPGTDKEKWEQALRKGFVNYATEYVPPAFNIGRADQMLPPPPIAEESLELVIASHHAFFDGRFAENVWLHELPDPVSRTVWDNVAAMSPRAAEKLGLAEGDIIAIKGDNASVELPVLVQPGMADQVIAATTGSGRTLNFANADTAGTNVEPLMQTGKISYHLAVTVSKTGRKTSLARIQKHPSMENRPLVLDGTAAEYRKDPDFIHHKVHHKPVDIYPPYDYTKGHHWAMAIDLSTCTGCGVCMIACQAENNVPVVGKVECIKGREMHWLRIDRYIEGGGDNPKILLQPMMCQHCDNAPCENVCPVNATTHNLEGLNQMVYNRCIGTRYCANNCPFKVRRFNFFDYQKRLMKDPIQELAFNPQVTVRSVGIMEKCSFCIQRINAEKYKAKNKDEKVVDGAIQTACQQACPAGAIVFGDLNDPESRVSRLWRSNRAYRVLEELNIKPGVAYLARIRNPHPDLENETDGGRHG
ncbi:4Fe-4S dicluster domain-containing protein [Acidobacteriota bacterium]